MSAISGLSSSYYSSAVSNLFSKIDSTSKGYIEESDLASAFSTLSSSDSSSSTDVSEIFSQLDSDSDGKVTEDEFSSSLENLASALDEQFNQTRMQGAMPPPPPPPPSGSNSEDTGFTEEELTAQLSDIGDSDSARSSLISSVLENFDTADSDGDGKVTASEAMSYAETNGLSPENSTAASTTASSASSTGFTAEELTEQLSEIGETDSARSSLISSIVENFDTADTNQDGTVSNAEAMAYAEANDISTNASSGSSDASGSGTSSDNGVADAQVFQQMMELMKAYGIQAGENNLFSTLSSAISTVA